jgi:hypothetical protein
MRGVLLNKQLLQRLSGDSSLVEQQQNLRRPLSFIMFRDKHLQFNITIPINLQ